jgi:hypothetical protein
LEFELKEGEARAGSPFEPLEQIIDGANNHFEHPWKAEWLNNVGDSLRRLIENPESV